MRSHVSTPSPSAPDTRHRFTRPRGSGVSPRSTLAIGVASGVGVLSGAAWVSVLVLVTAAVPASPAAQPLRANTAMTASDNERLANRMALPRSRRGILV